MGLPTLNLETEQGCKPAAEPEKEANYRHRNGQPDEPASQQKGDQGSGGEELELHVAVWPLSVIARGRVQRVEEHRDICESEKKVADNCDSPAARKCGETGHYDVELLFNR